jgi:hypothetical protein
VCLASGNVRNCHGTGKMSGIARELGHYTLVSIPTYPISEQICVATSISLLPERGLLYMIICSLLTGIFTSLDLGYTARPAAWWLASRVLYGHRSELSLEITSVGRQCFQSIAAYIAA